MSSLEKVPVVEIDRDGVFKYILVEASSGGQKKLLVRGDQESPYHADVLEKLEDKLKKENLRMELRCTGGGRIDHDSKNKHIKVYGYSVGFGKADHKVTCNLLKEQYKDYKIDFSNDGY
ncbi:hypothetical protein HELRODRAFT_108413 [Helobdella robusta]|uniref:Sex-regulated protein janus-B n=1 Tax=Helobdella robusta TaxID=6412 RepID=T1EEI7_HELRO|nr:hypothetical protein HELRODRAFT_108413 [Helobdella robusta]ESN91637.1 hypothetical protein HELRODRAFT_108413 [Helobdella robusta]